MKMQSRIIIIGGTGQNTGKTTIACKIIEKLSGFTETIGIKIATHFHEQDINTELLLETEKFQIYNEKSTDGTKDSSKMLISGARQVFYIQAKEEFVKQAFEFVEKQIPKNSIIVCESFTLGKQISDATKILMLGGKKEIEHEYLETTNFMLNFSEIGSFVEKISISDKGIIFN